jgi:hypothetical protein
MNKPSIALILLLFANQAVPCQMVGPRGFVNSIVIAEAEFKFVKSCYKTELYKGKYIEVWEGMCMPNVKRYEKLLLGKSQIKKGEYCAGIIEHGNEQYGVIIDKPCPEQGAKVEGVLRNVLCKYHSLVIKDK